MNNFIKLIIVIIGVIGMCVSSQAQTPLGADFTYQGELVFNDQPVNGMYDFRVSVYDALTNGNQQGIALEREAVNIDQGIFMLNLDFGDAIFLGNEVFLEIQVRENNSTDPYSTLLPRQKISNTPYAIHAQFVESGAVTSEEIADGSIKTQDLEDNSITTAKLANNSIGTLQVESSQVQRRVFEACSAGSFIISINEDGSVNCESDQTGLSEVTGADIVDGSVENIDIADGTIGSDEINSTQVQRRVSSVCDGGFYLSGINEDGSVMCEQLPIGLSFDIGNTTAQNIESAMVLVETTGLPLIAAKLQSFEAFYCTNINCSEVDNNTINSFNHGFFPDIIIRDALNSQLPMISHYNTGSDDLYVYDCADATCSSGTNRALDFNGNVGLYTSIAIQPDAVGAFPQISYHDATNGSLKIYNCLDINCTSGYSLTLDNSSAIVGQYTSIAVASNSFPIITYLDRTTRSLKVFDCTNSPNCSGGVARTLVNSVSFFQLYTDIVLTGPNELPVISYNDGSGLAVYECTDSRCINGVEHLLDEGTSPKNTKIVIGKSGFPVISYFDSVNEDLKIYFCSDYGCSSGFAKTLVSSGDVGYGASLVIGLEGNPIITYLDRTDDKLKVYSCVDEFCSR